MLSISLSNRHHAASRVKSAALLMAWHDKHVKAAIDFFLNAARLNKNYFQNSRYKITNEGMAKQVCC